MKNSNWYFQLQQPNSSPTAMTKAYMRHPLIQNPAKWLKKRKALFPTSYSGAFYNVDSLHSNPHAQLLAGGTSMDVHSRNVFPKGSLVRLTTEVLQDGNNYIIPAINAPPRRMLYAKSYVLNSRLYVVYLQATDIMKKYVPLKARTKGAQNRNFHALDTIASLIPSIYVNNIVEQAGTAVSAPVGQGDSGAFNDGVVLDLELDLGAPVGGWPVVYGNFPHEIRQRLAEKFGGRTFLPCCDENAAIIKNLALLSSYYSRS